VSINEGKKTKKKLHAYDDDELATFGGIDTHTHARTQTQGKKGGVALLHSYMPYCLPIDILAVAKVPCGTTRHESVKYDDAGSPIAIDMISSSS
jgi:hypothetical protein